MSLHFLTHEEGNWENFQRKIHAARAEFRQLCGTRQCEMADTSTFQFEALYDLCLAGSTVLAAQNMSQAPLSDLERFELAYIIAKCEPDTFYLFIAESLPYHHAFYDSFLNSLRPSLERIPWAQKQWHHLLEMRRTFHKQLDLTLQQ